MHYKGLKNLFSASSHRNWVYLPLVVDPDGSPAPEVAEVESPGLEVEVGSLAQLGEAAFCPRIWN